MLILKMAKEFLTIHKATASCGRGNGSKLQPRSSFQTVVDVVHPPLQIRFLRNSQTIDDAAGTEMAMTVEPVL